MEKMYTDDELACIVISRSEDARSRNDMLGKLHAGDSKSILAGVDRVELAGFLRGLNDQGIVALTMKSGRYPTRLLNLGSPPVVLYCRGNLDLLSFPMVAMIGTRDCTRYGREVSFKFGKEFASRGLVVVSGLADGIDTAAHEGAVAGSVSKVGGSAARATGSGSGVLSGSGGCGNADELYKTVAVLGNGLNVYYPKANVDLQRKLFKHGLVISEYLPAAPSTRFTFPHRNRIVAALSGAVVIVEADLKSGTMITRDWALDLGVDVFAVPGPITSHASRGTNQIIKEAGCAIVTSVDDVLEHFGVVEKVVFKEEQKFIQLSFDEKRVVDILGGEEVHFDELVDKVGLPIRKLSALLTNMEMTGIVQRLPGNMVALQS